MDKIKKGDLITLYSIEKEDIIEFTVGDRRYPVHEQLCINKSLKDTFSVFGETFVIQYIEKSNIYKFKQESLTASITNYIKKQDSLTASIKSTYSPFVDYQDFIVRTNIYKCSYSNHTLIPVNAVIGIMKDGKITNQSFPGMYCEKCNKYFIYENTYRMMKRMGYLCCKVIEYADLISESKGDMFDNWKQKSILNLYGYTVEKNAGLSDKQRAEILAFLIENDIITPNKIIDYLESFIMLRKNNKNMSTAISKWRKDIDYVLNYKKSNINIRVRSILAKK